MWWIVGVGLLGLWVYGYRIGHWFMFAALVTAVFALIIDERPEGVRDLVLLTAGVVAWFVSGVPLYLWRWHARRVTEAGLAAGISMGQDAPFEPRAPASSLRLTLREGR